MTAVLQHRGDRHASAGKSAHRQLRAFRLWRTSGCSGKCLYGLSKLVGREAAVHGPGVAQLIGGAHTQGRQRSDTDWWTWASVRSAQGGFSVAPTCWYRCASTGHEPGHPSFDRSGRISGSRCWLRHGRGSPVWLCVNGPGRQLGVAGDRLRDFLVVRAILHLGSCPCAVCSASTSCVDRDCGGCGGLAVPHHPPDQRGQHFLPHGWIPGRFHGRARPPQPARSCRAPRYVRPAGRRRPSAARACHLRPESHAGPQLPRHDLPAAGGLRLPDLPAWQQDRAAPCRPGPHGLCQDCGAAPSGAASRRFGRLSPATQSLR